jgi:hypothetical protein
MPAAVLLGVCLPACHFWVLLPPSTPVQTGSSALVKQHVWSDMVTEQDINDSLLSA